VVVESEDAPVVEAPVGERIRREFDRGTGYGLLHLGAAEIGEALPPAFVYWRELGSRFVTAVCSRPDASARARAAEMPPPPDELGIMAGAPPLMPGAEYLTSDVLRACWSEIGEAFAAELLKAKLPLQDFLRRLHPGWNLVGRVHFNLAENRNDELAPFAFLASYTHRLSAHGKAQHLPLGQALREYASSDQKEKLLALLLPVQRAAEHCDWLRRMIDAGEIFHPLRWSAVEASCLLHDVAPLENAGIVVRMPAAWSGGRPSRPQVVATIGARAPSSLGMDALLDFSADVTLDGDKLSPREIKALLAGMDGLALIRGRWVEVDRRRLEQTMSRFQEAARLAEDGGLPFAQAMRMLAGTDVVHDDAATPVEPDWSRVVAGKWLSGTLAALRTTNAKDEVDLTGEFLGTLRPYQIAGVRWLHLLSQLGLGACLADDMGLGKTIQVLALLVLLRRAKRPKQPSVLIAPASLLANWASEIDRFTPGLEVMVAHSSFIDASELEALEPSRLEGIDLVITSYGSLQQLPWLGRTNWQLAILDEAQAIKNPDAKQTRAAKKLASSARIALTGTPIENRLGDLWSIFDFLNPGLLGSAKEFSAYSKRLADREHNPYGPLRDLVRPYILRRLKTDRTVITDLPDKTEVTAFCQLSRRQAALYQKAVNELEGQLDSASGIQRRGVVLAFLMRFKQICNHPSQWLGDGVWNENDSGKWTRLREIAEVIASRQQKVLVFTQFREVTAPLASFLGDVFGRTGLVLHGQTDVKKRRDLVMRFQEDESVPFFVLSLKAGGTGLNLTAASHVIHFDRWWNPAVENQATDRAYRIGQRKNVLVHKLVCRGTVEEKIDALIESKKRMARELLEGGAELSLTEMSDVELLRLVALDLDAAMKE